MPKRFVLLLAAATLAVNAFAVETKFWRQDDQPDFEKGSLKGLSLRSDGRLMLAPAVSEIFDASTPYLWAVARDSKGNVYLGGGGSEASAAHLYKVDAAGKDQLQTDLVERDGVAKTVHEHSRVVVRGKVERDDQLVFCCRHRCHPCKTRAARASF